VDARLLPGLAKERAILLLAAGRWAESLEQTKAALPRCVADLGPNHSECRELMFYKANAMLRLGMTRVASDLPSLQAMADDQKSPALGADTLLLMLKVESLTGTPVRQAAAFERLRSLIESAEGIKFGPGFRARAMLVLADAKLRADDEADAERWIGKALALLRRDDGSLPASLSVAVAKSLQGVALLRRGRSADAFESLQAARDDASKLLGPDDPMTRLFSLNAALALETLGRIDEALALVEQAGPPLHKAMGSDAPTYLRVKELQGRLEQLATSGVALQRNSNPSVSGSSAAKFPHLDFFS
jgi:tetratricopeptide (TPR) repeat protein